MHPTEPRLLHELGLLFVRQAVDDAPAVALVALHPKDWLRHLLRLGGGGGGLGRLHIAKWRER